MTQETQAISHALLERSRKVIPGGVNSPVRAFGAVGGEPPFIARASGCRLETEDGASLIDYVGSWGPAILGHAHPEVIEAVERVVRNGLGFGAPTRAEADLAEQICSMIPSMNGGMVRLVSSGTEATMSALRLARGFTKRDKIIKFDGGYHGHADLLLIAAGSGLATMGMAASAGVPKGAVADSIVVPYNDLAAVEAVFAEMGDQIAAIIVEPVAGNMGCVPPKPGFLEGLRAVTQKHGSVLIFDEVMTGFRVARGGAQERFGITPDLTCLGKIVGGGLPVGAYGGRRDIMEHIAPLGAVYQAGTLSGNPLSVAAGLSTLRVLDRDRPYAALEAATTKLTRGMLELAKRFDVPYFGTQVGSMFCGFFHGGEIWNYDDAKKCDTKRFGRFHRLMLENGVNLAPSQFEAGFVSTAHDDAAISATLQAVEASLAASS